MLRIFGLAILLTASTLACAASEPRAVDAPTGGTSAAATNGAPTATDGAAATPGAIDGKATRTGPACATPGPECEGPAVGYLVEVFAKDGTTRVTTAKTDATGAFHAEIAPGDYVIFVQRGLRPADRRRTDVHVDPAQTVTVDLAIDSGAR